VHITKWSQLSNRNQLRWLLLSSVIQQLQGPARLKYPSLGMMTLLEAINFVYLMHVRHEAGPQRDYKPGVLMMETMVSLVCRISFPNDNVQCLRKCTQHGEHSYGNIKISHFKNKQQTNERLYTSLFKEMTVLF